MIYGIEIGIEVLVLWCYRIAATSRPLVVRACSVLPLQASVAVCVCQAKWIGFVDRRGNHLRWYDERVRRQILEGLGKHLCVLWEAVLVVEGEARHAAVGPNGGRLARCAHGWSGAEESELVLVRHAWHQLRQHGADSVHEEAARAAEVVHPLDLVRAHLAANREDAAVGSR